MAFASAVEPTAQYHKGAYGVVPTVYKTHVVEAEAPAQYEFQYSVNDQHTGDVKEQKESRNGDSVRGHYSLIDADGHRRTVEYSVDGDSGFVAVVHREPVQGYAPAKVVAKVPAAPVYQTYQAAPSHVYQQHYEAPKVATLKVAAPVAYQTYTAPVAKVASPVVYSQAPVHQHGYNTHTAPLSAYKTEAAVAKVAYAAPVAKVLPAPTVYAAPTPVYQEVHAAPVAKVAVPAYQPVAKVAAAPAGHSYVTYSGPNSSYQY